MTRRVTILGSTGSVGRNTVELVGADPESYEVEALVALKSAELLARQARAIGAKDCRNRGRQQIFRPEDGSCGFRYRSGGRALCRG